MKCISEEINVRLLNIPPFCAKQPFISKMFIVYIYGILYLESFWRHLCNPIDVIGCFRPIAYFQLTIKSSYQRHHGKNCFVTATKLGTTNEFFVASTENFAAATKRFVDRTKHFVVVTKYFCCPYVRIGLMQNFDFIFRNFKQNIS